MSTTEKAKELPAYRIYSVMNYSVLKEGSSRTAWQEIGSAWKNKDGLGLNLYFKARPMKGAQIVLRAPKAKQSVML